MTSEELEKFAEISGFSVSELDHLNDFGVFDVSRVLACTVRAWMERRVKDPTTKTYKDGTTKVVRVGNVQAMWEASEKFGLSFDTVRRYWYGRKN